MTAVSDPSRGQSLGCVPRPSGASWSWPRSLPAAKPRLSARGLSVPEPLPPALKLSAAPPQPVSDKQTRSRGSLNAVRIRSGVERSQGGTFPTAERGFAAVPSRARARPGSGTASPRDPGWAGSVPTASPQHSANGREQHQQPLRPFPKSSFFIEICDKKPKNPKRCVLLNEPRRFTAPPPLPGAAAADPSTQPELQANGKPRAPHAAGRSAPLQPIHSASRAPGSPPTLPRGQALPGGTRARRPDPPRPPPYFLERGGCGSRRGAVSWEPFPSTASCPARTERRRGQSLGRKAGRRLAAGGRRPRGWGRGHTSRLRGPAALTRARRAPGAAPPGPPGRHQPAGPGPGPGRGPFKGAR